MAWRPCCCGAGCCNGAVSTWPATLFLTILVPTRPSFDHLVYTMPKVVGPGDTWQSASPGRDVSAAYYPGDFMLQTANFGCGLPSGFFGGVPISGGWPHDGRDRCFFGNIRLSSVDCATKTVVFDGNMVSDGFNPCSGGDPFQLVVNP